MCVCGCVVSAEASRCLCRRVVVSRKLGKTMSSMTSSGSPPPPPHHPWWVRTQEDTRSPDESTPVGLHFLLLSAAETDLVALRYRESQWFLSGYSVTRKNPTRRNEENTTLDNSLVDQRHGFDSWWSRISFAALCW